MLTGHTVIEARGRKRVSGLVVAPRDADGRIGAKRTLSCDCVGMSGGWTPAVHLFSQSRGKLRYDAARDAFVPGVSAQAEASAGACNGTYDLAACLVEGFAAGARPRSDQRTRRHFEASATATGFKPVRLMPTDAKPTKVRAFVDFQNDVTAKDIKLAVSEGFESVEHVKRYTTTGMATDQGKTSNMNALGIIGGALDRALPAVGTTTFRPPYTPVTFGTLVGPARDALFDPIRTTPIHEWAVEHGAAFENVALWRRAWYFPRGGEDMHAAVARECKAVRESVGIFDASTLGKIEVVGRDAAEVHEPPLYQRLAQARARPLPLWPDAEGGRLRARRRRRRPRRAGPLPRDDDDRRRAARALATWRTTSRPSGRTSTSTSPRRPSNGR